MSEERQLKVGEHVVFVDALGQSHSAIVTAVWGTAGSNENGKWQPSANVVFVSGDEAKTDTYGRQIERETSVVYKSSQPAHGMFWHYPEDV